MTDRAFDIVVFGATGFTGRLVVARLAEIAPDTLRLAIAGRSAEKLAAVAAGVSREIGQIVADVSDPASLPAMSGQTRVLITTVGPYAKYGEPVVDACVATSTHYLDITGEPDFVADIQSRHHEAAQAAGVAVVSCCGFDSIPADLGAYYTASQLPPGAQKTIQGYVTVAGSFSGGTWASALNAMAELRQAAPSKGGDSARKKTKGPSYKPAIHYNEAIGGWGIPMPVIDPLVVKRSAKAMPEVYGPSFAYGHFLRRKKLHQVAGLIVGVGAVAGLAQFSLTRAALLSYRKSGEGPNEAERAKGYFRVDFIGEADSGETVRARVTGGDPGYTETSKMLSEAALLLITDPEIPNAMGVVTTAAAFGMKLIERLNNVGITFEVVD